MDRPQCSGLFIRLGETQVIEWSRQSWLGAKPDGRLLGATDARRPTPDCSTARPPVMLAVLLARVAEERPDSHRPDESHGVRLASSARRQQWIGPKQLSFTQSLKWP